MTDQSQSHNLPFDAWETTSGSQYDVTKVYTDSKDKQKEGTSLRVKVPSDIASEIAKIVAKDWVPQYRTTADFVRDAIVHRMHYWSELISDGQLQRVTTSDMRRAETERLRREVQDAFSMCAMFEDTLRDATRAKDILIVESVLTNISEALEDSREPYSSTLRRLYREYGKVYQELMVERGKMNGE